MIYIVYKTVHIPTGMFYIGKHNQKIDDPSVFDGYYGSGSILKKLPKNELKREVLFILETEEEAFNKEKEIVTSELIKNPKCLNLTTGGKQGVWQSNIDKIHDIKRTKWMHSDELHISVRAFDEEIEAYKNKGFKFGRSLEDKKRVSESMKGLCWINNKFGEKQIHKNNLEYYLNNGWVEGRSVDFGDKIKKSELNKNGSTLIYRYNNGKLEETRVSNNILNEYLKNGWKKGSVSASKSTTGKFAISNPKTMEIKYVKSEYIDDYINDGWILGNLKKQKR